MATREYSGIVSPQSTADLLAVRDKFLGYGPEVQRRMEDAGEQQLTGAWTDELGKRNGISQQQASIVKAFPDVAVAGASVIAATGGIGPYSARSGNDLGKLTRQFEFGADREAYRPVRQRGLNGKNSVRRTRRQLPGISSTGYIAYPAAGAWSKRVYAMYLAVAVLVAHEAVEATDG